METRKFTTDKHPTTSGDECVNRQQRRAKARRERNEERSMNSHIKRMLQDCY